MKRTVFVAGLLMAVSISLLAQNQTDVRLKWKDKDHQETVIVSESGDLYRDLDHHGPAIENEWMALRLYFDHKVAIDVYNKQRPGLELAEAGWYPTVEQQKEAGEPICTKPDRLLAWVVSGYGTAKKNSF